MTLKFLDYEIIHASGFAFQIVVLKKNLLCENKIQKDHNKKLIDLYKLYNRKILLNDTKKFQSKRHLDNVANIFLKKQLHTHAKEPELLAVHHFLNV